jgi:hypothetical protein
VSRRKRATPPRETANPPSRSAHETALPFRHPAFVCATLIAAACVIVSASYRLYDTDLWQLLVTGKAMWTLQAVPQVDLWTWRSYGQPEVTSSWLFRALLWPLWSAGGIAALYAWRWAATLAAFAFAWATARRMGALGFATLVLLVWCALVYRIRTDVRPETLAAVLFAATAWILETRRQGGPDRAWWIVPLVWIWANAHISWYLAFVLLAIHLAAALARTRTRAVNAATPGARTLVLVTLASVAVAFVNPFGWRALWQPFEFLLFWRNEPLYRDIGELHPIVWSGQLRNGLPLLMAGWPLLLAWRWRQRGADPVELMSCTFFTLAAIRSQRFLGIWALAAAPYLARDVQAWLDTRRRLVWNAPPWARAALAGSVCVALCVPEWARPELPLGVGFDRVAFPVAAADFMAAHRVRGRAFNHFHLGGYLAWRGWPERDRLPFMSTQPENSPREDRVAYLPALSSAAGWQALDARHHFDYAVLDRAPSPGDHLLDTLDGDSAWAVVFLDDAAAVFVRRDGTQRAVADSFAYRALAAGPARGQALFLACATDTALRRQTEIELMRAIATSRRNAGARRMLGVLALTEGNTAATRDQLAAALAEDPALARVHELLGMIALDEGRPRDALRDFSAERRRGPSAGLDLRMGQAWSRLGEWSHARAAYTRELARDPSASEARDSLAALAGR